MVKSGQHSQCCPDFYSSEMFTITKEKYIKMTCYFKNNSFWNKTLKIVYRILPAVIFAAYPMMLLYALFLRRNSFLKILIIPAAVFFTVTVLRKLINRKRPYEKFDVEPVFFKNTKGQSMPSRHTASAFIISAAALYLNFPLGVIMLAISCLIALSRILAGVHFPGDVAVATLISLAFSALLYV